MPTYRLNAPRGVWRAKLYDELLAALPALRPVAVTDAPYPVAQLGLAAGATANEVIAETPDTVTAAQVQAVVNVHDPTPPPLPPDSTRPPALPQALRDKLQPGGGSFTAAEQMIYNRWVYLVLRWLARQTTGSAE